MSYQWKWFNTAREHCRALPPFHVNMAVVGAVITIAAAPAAVYSTMMGDPRAVLDTALAAGGLSVFGSSLMRSSRHAILGAGALITAEFAAAAMYYYATGNAHLALSTASFSGAVGTLTALGFFMSRSRPGLG
jgi:hypothetical protein